MRLSFNTSCVAWISTRACGHAIETQWKIMTLFFLATTIVVGFIAIATVIRRLYLIKNDTILFRCMAPALIVWIPMHIFYTLIHGFSPSTNFSIPTWVISAMKLHSSMVLGTPLPQLIITWLDIDRKSREFGDTRYQIYYWIGVGIFTIIDLIITALAGVDSNYYRIWMRVTMGVWATYLLISTTALLILGLRIYTELGHSLDVASPAIQKTSSSDLHNTGKEDTHCETSDGDDSTVTASASVVDAKRRIRILLGVLCPMFTLVIVAFILYAILLDTIERNGWAPIVVWSLFDSGTILFELVWSWHFWTNTNKMVNQQQSSQTVKTLSNVRDDHSHK